MRPDNAFGRRQQDAMWERIKAELRRNATATPCEYNGCLPDEWITYEKAERVPGSTVFLVERGEARTCLTCGQTVYRGVEWTLEDHHDAQPWAA